MPDPPTGLAVNVLDWPSSIIPETGVTETDGKGFKGIVGASGFGAVKNGTKLTLPRLKSSLKS